MDTRTRCRADRYRRARPKTERNGELLNFKVSQISVVHNLHGTAKSTRRLAKGLSWNMESPLPFSSQQTANRERSALYVWRILRLTSVYPVLTCSCVP